MPVQNQFSNSWDIADIVFLWVVVGWGGMYAKSFLGKAQPVVLRFGWGFGN